jgi:hypothetical protein
MPQCHTLRCISSAMRPTVCLPKRKTMGCSWSGQKRVLSLHNHGSHTLQGQGGQLHPTVPSVGATSQAAPSGPKAWRAGNAMKLARTNAACTDAACACPCNTSMPAGLPGEGDGPGLFGVGLGLRPAPNLVNCDRQLRCGDDSHPNLGICSLGQGCNRTS